MFINGRITKILLALIQFFSKKDYIILFYYILHFSHIPDAEVETVRVSGNPDTNKIMSGSLDTSEIHN